ncbi:hypothetical protein PPERSA_00679 [Pseudocohnilembus persalinus]|uniref:Transmembrane protein n=1 Tax=Pseudocohnilembus persalinus TaxID=266149 RepID=A0A0V0QST7_PSEPJ|nr:hypothetical protein PPERSA_00679 [Pseudocohnilembus persalinus]|eukprot:KRX05378.1 hypothetical protein PPERSA_00679 [Pseudocohnilembus persalinus]
MKLLIIITTLLLLQGNILAIFTLPYQNTKNQNKNFFSYLSAVSSTSWEDNDLCSESICNADGFFEQTVGELGQKIFTSKKCEDFTKEIENSNPQSTFPSSKLQKCINSLNDLDSDEQNIASCLCQCGDTSCYNGSKATVASQMACELTKCSSLSSFTQQQQEKYVQCVQSNDKCEYNVSVITKLQNKDFSIYYKELQQKEYGECISTCAEHADISQKYFQCPLECMDNFSSSLKFYLLAFLLLAFILI